MKRDVKQIADMYVQPTCEFLLLETENVLCTSGEEEKEVGINEYTEFIDSWI